MNIFSGPPDFINAEGVKWWHDDSTTKYARNPDKFGTTLDVQCWYVEFPNGSRTRVLINADQQVIEESQTLDGIGIKIDMRKMLLRDHERNPKAKVKP